LVIALQQLIVIVALRATSPGNLTINPQGVVMQPEYRVIEEHIKRAQLERSLYIAGVIADGIIAVIAGFNALAMRIGAIARQGKARFVRAYMAG
jgi:hypothetical protein